MNYLAKTISARIVETAAGTETARFVLPSYPARVLLEIGDDLEERFAGVTARRVRFVYWIARRLVDSWGSAVTSDGQAAVEARERGWYNQDDNLTALRNRQRDPAAEDALVTVIAGYDHVDDQASLRDFYHLDQHQVRRLCLRGSFRDWVAAKLTDESLESDGPAVESTAQVLDTLCDHGLADLPGISRYLEDLYIADASGPAEVYRRVLGHLEPFNLPNMASLGGGGKRRTLGTYIAPAQEFLNYSKFLEDTARRTALRHIDQYSEAEHRPEPSDDELGGFGSTNELVRSLRRYVETGSDPERERLKRADFPFILDNVLGFRRRGTTPVEPKVKKLSGLAPEVFLHAMWLTLGEYMKDSDRRQATPQEELRGISLESQRFSHDLEADQDDEGTHGGLNDRAREFLQRTLGGLDRLLEEQIDLSQVRGGEPVPLRSRLCPGAEADITYARTATSEPHLAFRVRIAYGGDQGQPEYLTREFRWRLPQDHQAYLLDELFHWAYEWYAQGANGLPAFTAPYIPELFLAQDEDDVNRLVGMALRSSDRPVVNLLAAPGISDSAADPVMPFVTSLSVTYQKFLKRARKDGLFAALEDGFDSLRQDYQAACDSYLQHATRTELGSLLFKAFFLFGAQSAKNAQWAWEDHADALVATPLHPAVLDMLRNQHAFLCEGFCTYASDSLVTVDIKGRPFSEGKWDDFVELARLERPVFATLRDQGHTLDSTVRGYDYFHLVGNSQAPLIATWRLLLDYEPLEDGDEVEDEDLFHETRASRLVRTVLTDYRDLHPHAKDGITVGAYCGAEVQPLIAGIDRYLERTLADGGDSSYSLRLVVFSSTLDDSSVTRWLDAWRDRWQAAEMPSGKRYYEKCAISIAYRVVPAERPQDQLAGLLRHTSLDVLFFTDFVKANQSHFDRVPTEPVPDDYRKFPVLEKACCGVTGGRMSVRRERILSHRRFELASMHSEVLARLRVHTLAPTDRHVVISGSDFGPWQAAVDAAHGNSSWVVCIDPSVDERILRIRPEGGPNAREIIGFGTGVGAHGEANFTVSTEQYSMVDIRSKIGSQLALLFESWNAATRSSVAGELVSEATALAGLSVVRATGPSQYVRDYISYALLRKLLPRDHHAFTDELVSLDAFRHWFNDGEDRTRPDLLRIRARIVNGVFRVEAQVIECKLANQGEGYLSEARVQVEAGLRRLATCMRPRESEAPVGLNDRPDQRYWWLQLHRLIASRGSTSMPHYEAALAALERLSEGHFDISWQGAVVAFWNDVAGNEVQREYEWEVLLDSDRATVPAWGVPSDFVRRVCLEGAAFDVFSGAAAVWRRCCLQLQQAGQGTVSIAPPGEPVAGQAHPEESQVTTGGQDSHDTGTPHHVPSGEVTEGGQGAAAVLSGIPSRILLGSVGGTQKAVYWEFGHRDLTNRHILVFGASGTGKTYTIQALLCELGKAGQNALIVDYTSGFKTEQLERVLREKLKPKQHVVRKEPLPINPFRRQFDLIEGDVIEEDPTITAQRVMGVFSEVYQLGDQQRAALYNAIRTGIAGEGTAFGLDGLMTVLEGLRTTGGTIGSSAASASSKIQPFVDMHPFGAEDPDSWERLFNDQEYRCHIIQLLGFGRDMARLITEFSLIDLYRYYRANGRTDRPRVIVLDEIQNLDHSLDSPLGQLLTEGRKFGISLILATQTLSNLDKDQRDRLFQASHKLFFRPADTELKSFAQILESSTGERSEDWERRLSSLVKGECYSVGPAVNEASQALDTKKYFKIRIKALAERF